MSITAALRHNYTATVLLNQAAGKLEDEYAADSPAFRISVSRQIERLEEEFSEMVAGFEGKDSEEFLDGAVDVFVIWVGLVEMMERAGFDVRMALQAVADNNLSKFTSRWNADQSVAYYCDNGVACEVASYTDPATGIEFFSVRRTADGKILKPLGYQGVDLSQFIPEAK